MMSNDHILFYGLYQMFPNFYDNALRTLVHNVHTNQ